MAKEVKARYSIAFKQQVVSEYQSGETIAALRRKYGIGGTQTIYDWIDKNSADKGRQTMNKKIDRNPEIEAFKAKNEALEKLVSQLALDKFMLESSLAVAEERLGYSIKKKPGTKSLTKR